MANLNGTKSIEEFVTCEFEIIFEQWNDPFDSIGLKIVTIIVYTVVIFASLIMLAFVDHETRGFFGHFRTLINQLLSYLYGGVSNLSITLCTFTYYWTRPQRICYSHWANGARNGVISIG